MRRYTTEEYKQKLYEVYGDEYELIEEYRNSYTKHKFLHKKCNGVSMMMPGHLLHKFDKCECFKRHLNILDGKRFGRLTALHESDRNKNDKYKRMIYCRCDCGKELEIPYSNLITGHTQSCGCYAREVERNKVFVDLTGQHLGMLQVLEMVDDAIDSKRRHYIQYKCLCDCGNVVIKKAAYIKSSLKHNLIPSCGCYSKIAKSKWQVLDLTNQRFGSLTAIRRIENRQYNSQSVTVWECKCDCGNIINVTTSSLRSGTTQSCGCTHIVSTGEMLISEILEKYLVNYCISYKPQHRFKDCKFKKQLPFDFAIFVNGQLKGLIEYDGEGHFLEKFYINRGIKDSAGKLKEVQLKDSIKTKYCDDHNIPLLRIPYWDKDKLEEIVIQFLDTLV